ncbi:hypothetical protein [Bradyrhizobium sp. Ce-3]|uniref:hypothetical protein n=1 Tax=Bradyrhizobium sp. Ce-3 TaxID=2913970 RepID=UPI001FB88A4A|nr:hypothetical protein [Bradyrhizobium sp. Ce-3]
MSQLFTTHLSGMVNGWFPGAAIYGFEMVDAPRPRASGASTAINRKFTANQFRRIFRDFSADLLQCRYFRFIDRC